MNEYCQRALDYLSHEYDGQRAWFSWRSRAGADGQVLHDFQAPWSLRYTVNTYLGLAAAERHAGEIAWLGPVRERLAQFLSGFEPELVNCGDRGLLLVALADCDPSHPAVERSLDQLERAIARGDAAQRLDLQQLAWMLWGAARWSTSERASRLADQLFALIERRFVHPDTGMPRHSTHRYRAHTVSFGSVVYFLRAMHEYGQACGSERASELFTTCLRRVLAIQGQDGAWPWMLDVRSAQPVDVYPIFTVHQDSMAMLFLFPAREYGLEGIEEAIERSFRWNLGCNELHSSIVLEQPYAWFYRSIERAERWPRARRYLRGLRGPVREPAKLRARVRFNRECRSYHPGWILYAWSAYAEAPSLPAASERQGAVGEDQLRALR
ncbi:MAG TPA: hypothetical protein VMD79_15080 [Solirubrobacteraceae bacterium]|nr:hypothetical protein [Solirubrobacteraceae bacterium]